MEIRMSFKFLIGSMLMVQGWSWMLSNHRIASALASKTSLSSSSSSAGILPYPRAAVSVAVRCEYQGDAYYLLVQRGKDPNKGRWSFPGGKLELGETALQGGKRELVEEAHFEEIDRLGWHTETIATHDSIVFKDDGVVDFHFLIGVCFAELKGVTDALPHVRAMDDAAAAQWWTAKQLEEDDNMEVTPGLIKRIQRTEHMYKCSVLL